MGVWLLSPLGKLSLTTCSPAEQAGTRMALAVAIKTPSVPPPDETKTPMQPPQAVPNQVAVATVEVTVDTVAVQVVA